MLKFVSLLSILTLSSWTLQAQSIAFIGDSISTGGGAHPQLAFDSVQLERVFSGEVTLQPDAAYREVLASWGLSGEDVQEPRRLELSRREFSHPLNWVFDRALHYVSHRYLDAETYTWGYLLGRKQGLRPEQILIAARDGERSLQSSRQVDRLLEAQPDEAPRHLFIFFTGNDLCGPDSSFATDPHVFRESIEQAIRYYVRNAKPSHEISYIWLVDPLSILQIVTSPDILQHKVPAYGQEVSCQQLQSGRLAPKTKSWTDPKLAPADLFLTIMGQGPRSYCPTLFAIPEGPAELQMNLGGLLGSYRKSLGQLAEKLQVLHPQFRIQHLSSTGKIQFKGEDMANDCFHLSIKGQMKIAQSVWSEMQATLNPTPVTLDRAP